MIYEIELSKSAEKFLDKISKSELISISKTIEDLSKNPRPIGVSKLVNRKNEYRVKTGTSNQYRIVYTIEDKKLLIYIITIADRKDVYKKK